MDDTIRILRGKAVSENAVNDDKSLRFNIESSTEDMHDTDIKAVVDLNEQFQGERNACTKYRVIATVQPYCTNVLFNTCTEIVRNEGSPEVEVVDGISAADLTHSDILKLYGIIHSPKPYEMIRNTEYSKDSVGYTYHPGLDIFNNHILRNRTYRVVNRPKALNPPTSVREVFNTIDDLMRDSGGNNIKRCCRLNVTDTSMRDKHLYDAEDILQFSDRSAINGNLSETDGWFGFYNTSVIPSKGQDGLDMDISRALNNKGNCEFVDMYPDRSLFSVTPKYNRFRNRLEYNWEWTLTYPFDDTVQYEEQTSGGIVTKDFKVVYENGCNALAVLDARYVMLANTKNAVMFRCAVRHNLKEGDKVRLYFNKEDGNGPWNEIPSVFIVSGVGDTSGDNRDYFFYIADTTLLEYIFAPQSETVGKWDCIRSYFYSVLDLSSIPQPDQAVTYYPQNLVSVGGTVYICNATCEGFNQNRFTVFNPTELNEYSPGLEDIPSEYDAYIRVGQDIYELYNHDTGLPYHTSPYDANRFIRNIVNNAFRQEGDEVPVSGQQGTLWSDYIRFRFAKTDGSLVSRYYVRKFRKLPNMKYGASADEPIVDCEFDSERYRLAYARTVYGDEIAQTVFTDSVDIEGLKDNLGRPLSEIYLSVFKTNNGNREWYTERDFGSPKVEFSHCFTPVTCGFDIFGTCSDTRFVKQWRLEMTDAHMICNDYGEPQMRTLGTADDIHMSDDWWYGDVAEFCPWTCDETVLADVFFRFNTAQRESDDNDRFAFSYDEIEGDDYDYYGFTTQKYTVQNAVHKREGYIYKPHSRIVLKTLGPVMQDSHRAVIPISAHPVQMDGIYIAVSTSVRHGMYGGEKVRLRDKTDASLVHEWWLDVVSVQGPYDFIMSTIPHGTAPYVSWADICFRLESGQYTIEVENTLIPDHAFRIRPNTYLWRVPASQSEMSDQGSEPGVFPFANGHLYIDRVFNLFVHRQDPYGCNMLYDASPKTAYGEFTTVQTQCTCDIVSEIPNEPIEIYKDESFTIC